MHLKPPTERENSQWYIVFTWNVFVAICCFPYINFFNLKSFNQPNAIIFAAILGLVIKTNQNAKNLTLDYLKYAVLMILGGAIGWVSSVGSSEYIIQKSLKYLSLIIIPYTVIKSNVKKDSILTILKVSSLVWFLVGAVQIFIDRNILTDLVYKEAISGYIDGGRGVLSLAPEPTFYGLNILFITVAINLIRPSYFYTFINVSQIIIFSQSSTCIAILGACLVISMVTKLIKLNKSAFVLMPALIIFLTAGLFFLNWLNPDSRLFSIANSLINNSFEINFDGSVNNRIGHVVIPLVSFIWNFGWPSGLNQNAWETAVQEVSRVTSAFEINSFERVMSGCGEILFETGLFSLPYLWKIYNSLYKINYKLKSEIGNIMCVCFGLSIWASVSFSTPIVVFIIGFIIKFSNNRFRPYENKQT